MRPRLVGWVLVTLLLGVLGALRPGMAWAADDSVDSWAIDYTVDEAGLVHVQETLVYRFGSGSGRHGIVRSLVAREPYDDSSDQTYQIGDVRVSSPNASSEVTRRQVGQGRDQSIELVIGSAGRVITSPTATYTLRYTVAGALRTSGDYDEFYWDALSGQTPSVAVVRVSVTVPGGVQQVSCYTGQATSRTPCTSSQIQQGKGIYRQQPKRSGDVLTVGAMVPAGMVRNSEPILVNRADAAQRNRIAVVAGLAALSAVVSPLAGLAYWRRKGRDLRYLGLPPGTVPGAGQRAEVGPSDPRIEIPVSFAPPGISVAEAGLLADGQVDVRETTATLIDLAVRGAIGLRTDERHGTFARLVDPARATVAHEAVLLSRIFRSTPVGDEVDLGTPGSLTRAHDSLVVSVRNQVTDRGWFTDVPHTARRASAIGVLLALPILAQFFAGAQVISLLVWVLPLVPVLITMAVIRARMRRGQRTATGRAITDQIEGFRLYLATAESDQLRFEEGEDIFSRYLPWAIIFEVADRWARVCQQLVDAGRLSAAPPAWYYGDPYLFNYGVFTHNLDRVITGVLPDPGQAAHSGTGFGGGTSFGAGGGFAGGGGGGGGVSSW